jgi:NAD(P)-dependent dehydrogenase (short-subunit alcohol dehydrogenase family)
MHRPEKKAILITGATDGLGKQVALDLGNKGFKLFLHGRNPEKAEAVLEEIRQKSGNHDLCYYNADLSSLAEVRRLGETLLEDMERLDVLINNAGVGPGPRERGRRESRDGHELLFAVNYLAHFLLTRRLLPLLRKSAPSRIVNVASAGQQAIDFDDAMLENTYDGLRAYSQSKLAMVMDTFSLAEELEGTGVTVNALHPATLMPTTMVKETDHFRSTMSSVEEGAAAVEYLAISPELDEISGAYFNGIQRGRAVSQAYDEAARKELRRLSHRLTRPDI